MHIYVQWRHCRGGGGKPPLVTPSRRRVTPEWNISVVVEFTMNTGQTTLKGGESDGSGDDTTARKGHHFSQDEDDGWRKSSDFFRKNRMTPWAAAKGDTNLIVTLLFAYRPITTPNWLLYGSVDQQPLGIYNISKQ